MGVLYLTEEEIAGLITMRDAIEAVEEAFRRLGSSDADNVPRHRAQAPGVVLHTMSAAAPYLGLAGWKAYSTTRSGARFHLGLYDIVSGGLAALLQANGLGQLRTGAATAVAAQWMAAHDATELGLFGSGWQAAAQVEGILAVRNIRQVFVYSRNVDRREQFCTRLQERLGIEMTPVDRPSEAAEDLPIVVTATTARQPVFDGHWLAEGTHVSAIGSNWLAKAEIDSTTVARADQIVCDSIAACRSEAGDFAAAIEAGIFDWSRAVELSDVVSGRAIGRSRPDCMTLFKSVGLAIEDVAVGAVVLRRARERGVGRELPIE